MMKKAVLVLLLSFAPWVLKSQNDIRESQNDLLTPFALSISPPVSIIGNDDTLRLSLILTNHTDTTIRICFPLSTRVIRDTVELLLNWKSQLSIFNSIAGFTLSIFDSSGALCWSSVNYHKTPHSITPEDSLGAILKLIRSTTNIAPFRETRTIDLARVEILQQDLKLPPGIYLLVASYRLDKQIVAIIPSFLGICQFLWGKLVSNAVIIQVR